MQVIVFEDTGVARLYPVTVGRLAYNITCGSFRLVDWLTRLSSEWKADLRGVVRSHLVEIQATDFSQIRAPQGGVRQPTLLVNARLVPSLDNVQRLRELVAAARPGLVVSGETIQAAYLGADAPALPAALYPETLGDFMQHSLLSHLPRIELPLKHFTYPHDIVKANMESLASSLEFRLREEKYREVRDGLFVADDATIGDFLALDTKQGPVLIDHGATIGPHCFLRGPAYIGPKARVIEHSAIKDAVSLGHTTKIGGEVEASVVEPYTNKQHHGFLGHSYLGSWINLGAGTCNSDLKNTYGTVKMEYRGETVPTGMQFVGCMMGDYAKTAINTGIFTGKTIGVCSMVYGFVTTNVPSFVNYARLFGQVTELTPEVMIATQQRMFARRKVEPRPCDAQLIHAMYELTRHERQLAHEPLSL